MSSTKADYIVIFTTIFFLKNAIVTRTNSAHGCRDLFQ